MAMPTVITQIEVDELAAHIHEAYQRLEYVNGLPTIADIDRRVAAIDVALPLARKLKEALAADGRLDAQYATLPQLMQAYRDEMISNRADMELLGFLGKIAQVPPTGV